MELKRPPHQQLFVQVAQQIEELIRKGELAPGDQLLPERQLAARLEVSRASVREALAMLVGKGVIAISPRDGAYIRQPSLADAVAPLTLALLRERQQVHHLFEVRQIIEAQAARLAALRRRDDDIPRLQALVDRVAADVRSQRPADESDTLFHVGIVETAGNPFLSKVMGSLIAAMMDVYAPSRRTMLADSSLAPVFLDEHQQIVAAIAARDPQLASEVMLQHLRRAQERIKATER